jgi:hypothetical protein
MSHENDKPARPVDLNPTLEVSISIHWRERGRGRRNIVVGEEDPELLNFVASLVAVDDGGDHLVSISPRLLAKLKEHKILVTPEEVPGEPELDIRLPDSLNSLLPQFDEAAVGGDLVLSENCYLQLTSALPDAIAERITRDAIFQNHTPLVWVDDPGTQVLVPFGLASPTGSALIAVLEGSRSIDAFSPAERSVLAAARILVPPSYASRRCAEVETWVNELAASYRREGFAVVRSLLSPLQVALYRSYFRALDSEGDLKLEDDVLRRRSKHRDPLCEFIHEQSVGLTSRILGQQAIPTYSFFGYYLPGAVLKPHRDRPQCKWNISLILDGDPLPEISNAWPLFLESNGQPAAVRLGVGDAVIYSGTDVTHWREPQGQTRTSGVFLHFVPPDFEGTLD